MTLEEAQKIAKIVGTADNGCPTCVSDLVDRLNVAVPEFRWNKTNDEWDDRDADPPGDRGLVVTVAATR